MALFFLKYCIRTCDGVYEIVYEKGVRTEDQTLSDSLMSKTLGRKRVGTVRAHV